MRFPVIYKCSRKRKRSLGKIGNLHHEEQQQQADAGCFENEKVTTTNCNILTKAFIYNLFWFSAGFQYPNDMMPKFWPMSKGCLTFRKYRT